MAQTVELKVGMSCQGCVGAVKRVLGKMEGVESFDIDIEKQKVIVKGNVEPEAVLQIVSKTGKKTSFWEEEPTAKEPATTEPEPAKEPTAEPETAKESMAEPETKPTEAVVIA